jgi:hypothetical protein
VEKWWQDVYIKWLQQLQDREQNYIINIICPHSGSLLGKHPFDQHKHQLSHNHSITIDAAASRMLLNTEYTTEFYREKKGTGYGIIIIICLSYNRRITTTSSYCRT